MADAIGGVDSGALASEAAAEAVAGETATTTEPTVTVEPAVTTEPVVATEPTPAEMLRGVEELPVETEVVTEVVTAVETEVETEVTTEVATLDDISASLAQAGIDLGVSRADLPAELHEAYDNLTNTALMAADAYQQSMMNLENDRLEMKQFATAIEGDPQTVLLTMAVTNPDAFKTAVEQFQEMQDDPRVKDMVLRELKADATLKAANRAQEVFQNAHRTNKTAMVVNAVKTSATRHGVDPIQAEEMVALSIRANGGDIDVRSIEGIVSRLRPVVAAPVAPPVATPAKVAAVADAPTAPVQGTGTPATIIEPEGEISPGLTHANRNPMIELVKSASRRATQAMRGE